MKTLENNKRWKTAFYLLVFIGLMLFFTCVHPLYIYDADDWTYVSSPRPAVPMPFGWNPTRILPEILMPLAAQIGVSCINPFLQDYIQSMAAAFAVVLSGAVLLYLAGMDWLMQKCYQLKQERYFLLLSILLWHFLPFCTADTQNQHMFYADNVTCVFYYIIPGLLNAGAALLAMSGYRLSRKNDALWNGVLLLGIYLCINSNMYPNFILTAAVCAELFYAWLRELREKHAPFWRSIWQVLRENSVKTGIVCVWLLSILLEFTGGRARQADDTQSFALKETLALFGQSVADLNKIWLIGTAVVIAAALVICGVSAKKCRRSEEVRKLDALYLHQMAVCGLCLAVSILYLVLLSAKVNPDYLAQSKVKFTWVIWCFIALAVSMAYLLRRCPKTAVLLPLLLCIVVSVVVTDGSVYAEYNNAQEYNIQTVKKLDENIIRQAQEAEAEGLETAEIHIPQGSEDWPLPLSWGGERIARTLYRHGLTRTKLQLQLVVDEEINREFDLNG